MSGRLAHAALWLCADVTALEPALLLARCARALTRAEREGLSGQQTALWLRSASSLSSRDALSLARACAACAKDHGARFIVGARPDLAVLSGADGVHVTSSGAAIHDVATYLAVIGASPMSLSAAVHDPSQAERAASVCEALVASPFGAVPGKNPPLSIAGLAAIVARAPARTVVALGGIDAAPAAIAALSAGARAVAVRRALAAQDERPFAAIAAAIAARVPRGA
jgi:thiamine-phosphate pyrophosphorylase